MSRHIRITDRAHRPHRHQPCAWTTACVLVAAISVKEIDQLLFYIDDIGLAVPDKALLEIQDAMTNLKKIAPDLFPEEMEY